MQKLEKILANPKVELWLKWTSRFVTIVLIPVCIWVVAWIKSTLLAHGNEHFVSREEYKYVPNNITDISNRVVVIENARWKKEDQEKFVRESEIDRAVVKSQLADIMETLRHLREDIKEIRTRQNK